VAKKSDIVLLITDRDCVCNKILNFRSLGGLKMQSVYILTIDSSNANTCMDMQYSMLC